VSRERGSVGGDGDVAGPTGAPGEAGAAGEAGEAGQVDLREAARRLHVHYMTAYRYVRTGRLPASQQHGRWWVRTADLEQLDAGPPGRPARRTDPAVAAGRLGNRLLAGDEAGAWQLLETALASGRSPPSAVLDILAPALRGIGDGWQDGDVTVAQEHRATAVATRLVGRLGPRFARAGRRRGGVVLACVPGEHHALPVALLALVLRGEGYAVVELGADTPAPSIAEAALSLGSRLHAVGLSASTRARHADLREAVVAVRTAVPDALVMAGGCALAGLDEARALGADRWAADAAGAVAVLEAAAPRPDERPPRTSEGRRA
jgi:methanogenic corrinoid protein MtbC1